ncbi:hypothetical protein K2X33_02070 [bacterium]|nr:hypothetical protein [bacterium]
MRFALFALLLCGIGSAATLPGALTVPQIEEVTRVLGMGAATRILRAADAYPSWPGTKIGVETVFLSTGNLRLLGNQTGSIDNLLIAPRIYLSKGLFQRLELTLSALPFALNTAATYGGALKWTFAPESEQWAAMAAWVGVTQVNAFQGEFEATTAEVGVVISKDYVRLKPFIGAALMASRGHVHPALAQSIPEGAIGLGTHLFVGAEIELPVQVSFQVEAVNADPAVSFFVGKHF